MESVFAAEDYRSFLKTCFPTKGENRGNRQRLAQSLGCQTSFLSLVLTERAHMSEEMFIATCDYLRLSSAETEFALLLFHSNRAGTQRLREHYTERIERMRRRYSAVEGALTDKQTLKVEEQIPYYSSWLHAAVHVAAMLKREVTIDYLARLLRVDTEEIEIAVGYLVDAEIIKKSGDLLTPGSKRVHLSKNSPLAITSHIQWKLEACRQLRMKSKDSLHFSGVYSLSKRDYKKIKAILEKQLLEVEDIIAPSAEEQLCGISLDLFSYSAD